MNTIPAKKPIHPVILDTLRASEAIRNSANQTAIPVAVANYLSAVAKHWEMGWLPATPTEIDKATVAIVKAVLSTYKLPGVDAGSSQLPINNAPKKGE